MKLKHYLYSLLIVLTSTAQAQETLNNQSVIALVEARISRGLIEEKIKTSQSKFDVSTNGLLDLKIGKVSEPLIEVMLAVSQPTDIMQNRDVIDLNKAGFGRKLITKKIEEIGRAHV